MTLLEPPVFLVRRPSDAKLSQIAASMGDARLTYGGVGATARPDNLPEGYHHVHAARVVGHGDEAFAAAVDGIRRWQLHRRQGYRVAPDGPPPVEGGTVVAVDVPLIAIHVIATCRITWVVDEPDRFGFGYGTLPIHPESGEEAFVVERDPHDAAGAVRLAITAFSRPRHPLVRLAGPIARRQQARATQGYLDALAVHVREVLA
jgi:uncharacterized protein (UPF0548 family)